MCVDCVWVNVLCHLIEYFADYMNEVSGTNPDLENMCDGMQIYDFAKR